MKKPNIFISILKFIFRTLVVCACMALIAVGSFEGVTYYLTGSTYDLRELTQKAEEVQDEVKDLTVAEPTSNIDQENTDVTLLFVQDDASYDQYVTLLMRNTETNVTNFVLVPLHAKMNVSKKLLREIQDKIDGVVSPVDICDIERAFGDEACDMITKVMESGLQLKISGYDVMKKKDFLSLISLAGDFNYNLPHAITYRDKKNQLQTIMGGEQVLVPADLWTVMAYEDATENTESNRLQRNSEILETLIPQLLSRNSAEAVAKAYKTASKSSEGRDLTNLASIIDSFGEDSIVIRILQGSEKDGIFTIDTGKAALQLSTLIKQANGTTGGSSIAGTDSAAGTGTANQIDPNADSRDCSIELYNAAYVSGIAGRWEGYLESEGYSISLLSNYQEEGPLSQTRIIVSEEGIGSDLLRYFPDAEISVGSISTGGDIRVLIGTDSTNVPSYTSVEDDESDQDESYSFEDDSAE